MPLLHVLEFASWADKWQSLSKPKKRVVIGLAVACPFVLVATVLRWDLWNDIDTNTYYYSLSTISQTLAGAFAFLAAVALFRMQSIEGDMERSFRVVIPYAPDHRVLLQMMNRSHDWHDLDRYVPQEKIDAISDDGLKGDVSTNLNAVKTGLNTLSDLKSELVDTLRLTSIVIGSSLLEGSESGTGPILSESGKASGKAGAGKRAGKRERESGTERDSGTGPILSGTAGQVRYC